MWACGPPDLDAMGARIAVDVAQRVHDEIILGDTQNQLDRPS